MENVWTEDSIAGWRRLPKHVYASVEASAGAVLLETARFDAVNRASYLFFEPVRVISAARLGDVERVFDQVEEALAQGFHVAGFLGYECGYAFERFAGVSVPEQEFPLAWFGVYRKPIVFDHQTGRFDGEIPLRAGGGVEIPERLVDAVELSISQEDYRARILQIKELIAAGETYQVNFTDGVSFPVACSPAVAYEVLSRQQPVAYSAFLNINGQYVASFSPELFFRMEGGKITTRPMKGTMRRGLDAAEDRAAALRLQRDEKNRSEHVMIVDLLRNDLGRVCRMGSVVVEDIFSVERYQTLFQMTSTVSGTLRPGVRYADVFKSMFPSGSVTGAPKIHTMQIIREMEQRARGVYCGAIGRMAPDGTAVFNVAIRTLVLKDGNARMGVGGGIVADSDPDEEYRECLLKASFLSRAQQEFQLIESLLWEDGFPFLEMHLDRMEASAGYFGFIFSRNAAREQLAAAARGFCTGKKWKVRMLLDAAGVVKIESMEIAGSEEGVRVRMAAERSSSRDVFLRHKTTRRALHEREYARAVTDGLDEVIFLNERSEVTEGAISNVLVRMAGRLLTPPLASGVLAGVYRRHLLESGAAAERVLTLDDLRTAEVVLLCNAVRGMRVVKQMDFDEAV